MVPLKQTIPILSNFLIEARNGKLTLIATDLTVGIECTTEVKVLEDGATTLPTKKFAQLIHELTGVNVQFNTSQNDITEIVCGTSRFKVNGMSKTEYPALPDLTQAIQLQVKQSDLKDALMRTAFAVSKDDNRYTLTGVYMQINNGAATFTGTDGKRLARCRLAIDIDPTISTQAIIPLKAVEEIAKNLTNEGEATLHVMHDKIACQANDTRIISKLLVGEYPDVTKVIPEKSNVLIPLHREELISLLRQMCLFTTTENHSARFSFRSGELNLDANANELGEGKVNMAVNYQGDSLDIAFNPHYFLDILRHCKGDTVSLGLVDSFNPGLITDQEAAADLQINANPLFMLMPLRLSE